MNRVGSLKTRVTDLFGVRYPIVQAGMIWVSGWKLARAVSEAGGLGLIGSGSMTPAVLEQHIAKFGAASQAPFGVNIPVTHAESDAKVEVCLRAGVKIVFISAGSPQKYTPQLKERGVCVVHVVPSATLARKAEAAGCDAVVAEGTEAGGHNGFDELTSFVLWPSVKEAVSIPVIAAGGIVDGAGMAAALALGADGVQVGTRFATSAESSASELFKEAVVRSEEAAAKLFLRRQMPTRALNNPFVTRLMEAEGRGAGRRELLEILGRGRTRRGIFEGDLDEGELEIGQAAGRITAVLPAATIVEQMVTGYRQTVGKLP